MSSAAGHTYRVLMISGSLRRGSTNTALLRTAQVVAPEEILAVLYNGLDALPAFNPDQDADPLASEVAATRAAIRAADALLISTPEYAGALPGALKNLLEWAIGDAETGSIYEKPAAWINASASPTGARDAHEFLRKVLGYAHAAVVDDACLHLPVIRGAVNAEGTIEDPEIRSGLRRALAALVSRAVVRRSQQTLEAGDSAGGRENISAGAP
jgi:chromate reductase